MNGLLDLLRESVWDALRHEVQSEIGIVCSGGLDSSTIACLASEYNDPYPLFTGWYRALGFDERLYSRLVPGVHHEVEITAQDFVDQFDAMAAALEPPWQGPGCLGQWMVARAMADDGVTVALSGEGADELFGGYARVMLVAGWERWQLPVGYREYRLPAGYPGELEAALAWEMEHLQQLLAADGRILAAHGIEGRAPFTDPRVVEYALALPAESRVNKTVLRAATLGVVPQPIRQRRDKMGFPAPFVHWAQKEPMRGFLLERGVSLPDPGSPWDRGWWNELLDASRVAVG